MENWKLYTGKEEDSPSSLGLAHRVVLDLLDDDRLKDKGYQVYMDNFYSSPAQICVNGDLKHAEH